MSKKNSTTKPKILAVITARGGSKGIPGKNIKPLGGKPLIAYSIDAAKKSKLITHLIVSTDDKKIARIAIKYGAEVPFLRPKKLAQDKTPHVPVMCHAIEFVEKKLGIIFDYAVILQPTSPFRLPEDIDNTLEKLIKNSADSAVSLVDVDNYHPVKAKKLAGDKVLPYMTPEPEGTRRQDFPPAYRRSGAIYAMRRDLLIKDNRLYGDYIVGHIVPAERSVDIDTPFEWFRAEWMLEDLKRKGYEF
ncbi:MAG: acylneuraminate cytidylyltransferase family protein [Candidatus Paceibacterota bacterium]|jgi:CMP-N-acetylneuraminic acid synthetase